MGRKKVDPLNGGFAERGGFWNPELNRIRNQLVKLKILTRDEWSDFIDSNAWLFLKMVAEAPSLLKRPGVQRDLALHVQRRPVLAPMFIGLMHRELRGMNHVMRWLWGEIGRNLYSDAELVTRYTYACRGTKTCTEAQMQNARERLYDRVVKGRQ
jgi:hypothetical protein